MERTFIVSYSRPLRYQGAYVVKAKDGIEAGNKVEEYLKETYGVIYNEKGHVDSSSIVVEVHNNQIMYI